MHLIGYGNPGRGDDGLGPAFAARMVERRLPEVTVSIDYQLTVDHALLIAGASRVVFVDALIGADAPYRFTRVQPALGDDLSSHSLSPSAVLALAANLYDAAPAAYVLGISGTEFGEIRERLSALAERNLDIAEEAFLRWLEAEGRATDNERCAHA